MQPHFAIFQHIQGGSEDSAYIDEQTIKSLFGSNYETKVHFVSDLLEYHFNY